jgi:hypothetical protein
MPIEENGRKRQNFTPECVLVIEKHTSRKSFHLIVEDLNISKSGAQKIIHVWKEDSILHIAPCTGGPRKLTESDERFLLLQSKRDPHATYTKLPHFPT